MRFCVLLALIGGAFFAAGSSGDGGDRQAPDYIAKDVARAIATGDTRFLGLMSGWGPIVPGVPNWVDLSPEDVRCILHFGCVQDEESIQSLEAAHAYAAEYNKALLKKMPSLATTRPARRSREVLGPPLMGNPD